MLEDRVDRRSGLLGISGAYRLKSPDAIQLATALEINATVLVTHHRDFSNVEDVRVLM